MTATTTDQVAVDLLAAADVLRTRGWTTTILEDSGGRVCMAGAVRLAVLGHVYSRSGDEPLFRTRIAPVCAAIEEHLSRELTEWMTVEAWNDKHIETANEAVELLESVAAERAAVAS